MAASQILSFKKTVAALTEDSEEHRVQADGVISEIVLHFPGGCNGLVDMRIRYLEGITLYNVLPSVDESFIALNDATPKYDGIGFPVRRGNMVKTEFKNYDSLNPHTISAQVVIAAQEVS